VYRFLLTRRWVSLMVTMLFVIPACVELGLWQLDRLHLRQQQNRLVHHNAEAEPRPVGDLTKVGGTVPKSDEWRAVKATGRYDRSHQLLVRNRVHDGDPGFYVLTPLVQADGPAVIVNRGWVSAPRVGGKPDVPAAPEGDVEVLGRLRPTEDQKGRGPKDASDVPEGQVMRIDVPRIAPSLPYPVLAGYVDLVEQDPPPKVIDSAYVPLPLAAVPSRSEALHWSYAAQWFIFALVGPIGFYFLVRREALDRRKAARMPAQRATEPVPGPGPGPAPGPRPGGGPA
jgi:cytochrome oxidase assembly protein ShyY1